MNFEIKYLPPAVEDLNAIANYLFRFYPHTYAKSLNQIEKRILYLTDNPYMYEKQEGFPRYRRIIADKYLVLYRIDEESSVVEIYRILRASWDIEQYIV